MAWNVSGCDIPWADTIRVIGSPGMKRGISHDSVTATANVMA